jgi:hypothetical protein
MRDLDPADAEREPTNMREWFVTRRTAELLLGLDPEAGPSPHPVEATLSRPFDEKTLGAVRPHEAGDYMPISKADYWKTLGRVVALLERARAEGRSVRQVPRYIPDPPVQEQRPRIDLEHLRRFAAYLVISKGGAPERVLGPQKRGRGAVTEAMKIRAEIAWELNKISGASRPQLASLFGVSKARVTQLINAGRPTHVFKSGGTIVD